MTARITITDSEWTIEAQVAEYQANDETPERARQCADYQEAFLVNNAFGHLPTGWRYLGNGTYQGPATDAAKVPAVLDIIGSLQIEACDFATADED